MKRKTRPISREKTEYRINSLAVAAMHARQTYGYESTQFQMCVQLLKNISKKYRVLFFNPGNMQLVKSVTINTDSGPQTFNSDETHKVFVKPTNSRRIEIVELRRRVDRFTDKVIINRYNRIHCGSYKINS